MDLGKLPLKGNDPENAQLSPCTDTEKIVLKERESLKHRAKLLRKGRKVSLLNGREDLESCWNHLLGHLKR